MTLEWLLGWWNLIFLAPFAVALLYLFVYTLTGVTFGDMDADADADADADHDSGHHGEGGHGTFSALALTWLGVGRVPLSLALLVLLLVWGAAGFLTNTSLAGRPEGWQAARVSLPVALVVSVMVTRAVVMLLARFVPMNDTSARPLRSLVGTVGEALYPINETFGMAVVRDANGDLKNVPCRVGDGVPPIEKGAAVRLVAFDAPERLFYVAAAGPAPVASGRDAKSADAL
jgi:membrane protein implicated in regulation of membrane protease activity